MQRSLFCRFSFALAAAIAATFAAQAETYYWIGGDLVTNAFSSTASKWATEDGTVVDSVPANDVANTLVFTNAREVAFSGAVTWDGGIIKRGSARLNFRGELTLGGTLTLEQGDFYHHSAKLTLSNTFALNMKGPLSKTFYLYGNGGGSHNKVTIPSYSETADALSSMMVYLYGNDSKTITFKGPENSATRFSPTMEYNGNFGKTEASPSTNRCCLEWDPGYQSAVMEIVGRVFNRQFGSLKVTSGTMRFAEGAGVTLLGEITVATGATLEIGSGAVSDTFGCPVIIENRGKLKVSRRKFTPAGGITYNGEAVPDGRYKAGDLEWLEGDGVLYIGTVTIPDEPATTSATWTGNGGDDTSVLNPANWGAVDNETLPDLTTGSLEASFLTGTEATVPAGETVVFKGFSVSASSFTLKGGVGSKVALGSSGVTVTGAVFTNECFTTITRSQTWNVAKNCRNVWAGEVAADWPTVDILTVTNTGRNVILHSNPNLCNVNYFSTLEAYADVPLGGCLVTATQKADDQVVECYGNVFSNNFDVTVNNWQHDRFNLVKIVAGENLFCGEFKSSYSNGHYWRFADSNNKGEIDESISATFKGGYVVDDITWNGVYTAFSAHCNGIINIEEKPISVVRMFVGWISTFRQILNLNVASNVTTRGIHILPGSTLNTTVPYALYATDDGQSGVQLNDLAVWNLSADQGVNVFAGITNTAKVSSANGATLHLRDDRLNTVKPGEAIVYQNKYQNEGSLTTSKVQTNKVVFAGKVCFSKEGILDHFMEGVSTSTGSISVKKGRMIFTTGSWQNASAVNVYEGGTLELRNANAFGRETSVSFEGENTDGMLVIPAGTNVRLRNVRLNGKILNGSYSSGLVAGGGTLTAGYPGMSIIFR